MMSTDAAAGTSWADEPSESNQREALQSKLTEELNPQRHCLHRFYRMIAFLTMFSALNMGIGQLIGMAYEADGPIQYILRVYVVALCCLTILNELKWTKWTKDSTLLRFWPTRGCVYIFIGVLGLEENDSSPNRAGGMAGTVGRAAAMQYTMVVAWMMIVMGFLYTILGIFCGQIVLSKLQEDYERRSGQAKETKRVADTYGIMQGASVPADRNVV